METGNIGENIQFLPNIFPFYGFNLYYDEKESDDIDTLKLKLRIRRTQEQKEKQEIWTAIHTEGKVDEGRDPFEELDTQLSHSDRVREIIECTKHLKSLPYKDRILNRLKWLLEVTLDDPEEENINSVSVYSFLEFIKSKAGLRYPDIILSPAGNIIARWRVDENRNLCIEFLSEQDVRFVVFAPHPIRTFRIAGIAPINELWNTLAPYKVERWVINVQ